MAQLFNHVKWWQRKPNPARSDSSSNHGKLSDSAEILDSAFGFRVNQQIQKQSVDRVNGDDDKEQQQLFYIDAQQLLMMIGTLGATSAFSSYDNDDDRTANEPLARQPSATEPLTRRYLAEFSVPGSQEAVMNINDVLSCALANPDAGRTPLPYFADVSVDVGMNYKLQNSKKKKKKQKQKKQSIQTTMIMSTDNVVDVLQPRLSYSYNPTAGLQENPNRRFRRVTLSSLASDYLALKRVWKAFSKPADIQKVASSTTDRDTVESSVIRRNNALRPIYKLFRKLRIKQRVCYNNSNDSSKDQPSSESSIITAEYHDINHPDALQHLHHQLLMMLQSLQPASSSAIAAPAAAYDPAAARSLTLSRSTHDSSDTRIINDHESNYSDPSIDSTANNNLYSVNPNHEIMQDGEHWISNDDDFVVLEIQ